MNQLCLQYAMGVEDFPGFGLGDKAVRTMGTVPMKQPRRIERNHVVFVKKSTVLQFALLQQVPYHLVHDVLHMLHGQLSKQVFDGIIAGDGGEVGQVPLG